MPNAQEGHPQHAASFPDRHFMQSYTVKAPHEALSMQLSAVRRQWREDGRPSGAEQLETDNDPFCLLLPL